MPKISVIIPVYNTEEYIGDCLDSVLTQTFLDFEIIVVDDGSTDLTHDILQDYAARDSRIKLLWQENSGKPSVARNLGICHASGEYITFLDSDDLYEPEKLERESLLLDSFPKIDIVFCDMYTSDQYLVKHNRTYLQQADFISKAKSYLMQLGSDYYLCRSNFYNFMSSQMTSVMTPTVMIRAVRLRREKILFPTNMIIGEDIDLWFRLSKGAELLYIDRPLSCNRQHAVSITKVTDRYYLGSVHAHSINYKRAKDVASSKELKLMASRIASNLFHLGYYYKINHRYFQAGKSYVRSLTWKLSLKTLYALLKLNISCIGYYMLNRKW